MGAANKLELTPDEMFLQDALRTGRAIRTEISMKALGKPDVELQARVTHLDMTHVHRLGMSLENQKFLAPVVVFKDADGKLWLADGHHRHECYRKARKPAIPAYQITGERLDALEFATMCNRENCLGRTKEDQKKALFMLLGEESWFNRSSPVLAAHIEVSGVTVQKWRHEYCSSRGLELPSRLVSSDGKTTKTVSPRNPKTLGKRVTNQHGHSGYRKVIDGELVWLGTSEVDAQKKLDELNRHLELKRARFRGDAFANWLTHRGVFVKRLNRGLKGFGSALLAGSSILIYVELCTIDTVAELVGRALLNRHKHLPDGRAIVVCYDPPECEALDTAKDMGIEFLTPEDLVESLGKSHA